MKNLLFYWVPADQKSLAFLVRWCRFILHRRPRIRQRHHPGNPALELNDISQEETAVPYVKGLAANGDSLATQTAPSLIILSVLVSRVFEFDVGSSVYQMPTPFVFSIAEVSPIRSTLPNAHFQSLDCSVDASRMGRRHHRDGTHETDQLACDDPLPSSTVVRNCSRLNRNTIAEPPDGSSRRPSIAVDRYACRCQGSW